MAERQGAAFARLASRPIPRVERMMVAAREAGYDPAFCGAFREEGLATADDSGEFPVVRLGRYFPLLNGRRAWLYLRSVIAYNRDLYRWLMHQRPALVHASDIETMPACLWFRRRHRARLIYNIHDNFAQRYRVPAPIAFAMNALEGWCIRRSDVAVVPEAFRRDALPRKSRAQVRVVRNAPDDPGYSEPATKGTKIRIFFGGWLDWGRGLRALLDLASVRDDVEVHIAGDGAAEIVAEIARHPRVRYLGFVDHATIMDETRRCHFVWALYDPTRPVNRYAASNKIAEALAVGRLPIVNAGLLIVETLGTPRCLIVTGYPGAASGTANLAVQLEALLRDPAHFHELCREARALYEANYAWPGIRAAMQDVLQMGVD